MAIFHLHCKIIKRSDGRTSTSAAAYRAGIKIYDKRTGIMFDYSSKSDVSESIILCPDNSPEWASDRSTLWNSVEETEKRKDSQLCREIEVSIPIELSNQLKKKLVLDFVKREFIKIGMIADISFHKLNENNPHAHIMLTMRDVDKTGFLKKNRSWNDKEFINKWRESWQDRANLALHQQGSSKRIDCRSLRAQGIERRPTQHIGPAPKSIAIEGREVEKHNQSLIKLLQSELSKVRRQIGELISSLSQRNMPKSTSFSYKPDRTKENSSEKSINRTFRHRE